MEKDAVIQVNIHEAKTHLSRLLNRVCAGEEVIIAKAGKQVARIVPFEQARRERIPGLDRGIIEVSDDFDAPLPDEVLESFES
jgi:prevent-host-death family protein